MPIEQCAIEGWRVEDSDTDIQLFKQRGMIAETFEDTREGITTDFQGFEPRNMRSRQGECFMEIDVTCMVPVYENFQGQRS